MLFTVVDNLEQCGEHNIVQSCGQQLHAVQDSGIVLVGIGQSIPYHAYSCAAQVVVEYQMKYHKENRHT